MSEPDEQPDVLAEPLQETDEVVVQPPVEWFNSPAHDDPERVEGAEVLSDEATG